MMECLVATINQCPSCLMYFIKIIAQFRYIFGYFIEKMQIISAYKKFYRITTEAAKKSHQTETMMMMTMIEQLAKK